MPKIKSVSAKKFKRFTDLTVVDIPETARLVVLLGPNGCGKTSLFELFNVWIGQTKAFDYGPGDYYYKRDGTEGHPKGLEADRSTLQDIKVEFHGDIGDRNRHNENAKKAFYLRSSHRHESSFQLTSLGRVEDPLEDARRPMRMIEPDARSLTA